MSNNSNGTPFKWTQTSPELLVEAESRVLSKLRTSYKGRYVNIGPVAGEENCQIWTISMNDWCKDKTPLVLVHGLAAGVGFWTLNLDNLAASGRPIYAIDLLGFARSSRPKFSTDPAEVEKEYVNSIEEWRKSLNLDKMVLSGHSMGGFISLAYSFSFPQRIAHLILEDPWGLNPKPNEDEKPLPFWVKVAGVVSRSFNPLSAIRAAGPLGQGMMGLLTGRTNDKFNALNELGYGHTGDIKFSEYAYHCNAQEPSGEEAFKTLSDFVWAKLPLVERIPFHLRPEVDLTVIYGKNSFILQISLERFQQLRNGPVSYTNVQILEDAGHEVHLDRKEEFNRIVLEACFRADDKLGN